MATLTLRNVKGSSLTFDELDSNFLALDSDITAINNTISGGVGLASDSVNSLIDARIDSDGFVNLTSNQTVGGIKTFSDSAVFSSLSADSVETSLLRVTSTTQGYTLPDSAGRAGQVLVTHGDGTTAFDSSSSAGVSGAINDVFWENSQTLSTSYTIAPGRSAMSAGPIIVDSAAVVTISSGSRWIIM
jgi:hypothetical protein